MLSMVDAFDTRNCVFTSQGGWSAMMAAVFNGHTDIVRYLKEHGAEVETTDAVCQRGTLPLTSTLDITVYRKFCSLF